MDIYTSIDAPRSRRVGEHILHSRVRSTIFFTFGRFGKFTKIVFQADNSTIAGSYIETYLLEKSRVVRQDEGTYLATPMPPTLHLSHSAHLFCLFLFSSNTHITFVVLIAVSCLHVCMTESNTRRFI